MNLPLPLVKVPNPHYAIVLGMGAAEWHELTDRRGRFDAATVAEIRDAIRLMLEP